MMSFDISFYREEDSVASKSKAPARAATIQIGKKTRPTNHPWSDFIRGQRPQPQISSITPEFFCA